MISVLLPVYNGEPHLREAIESILNQTYTDFELLIINDGSSDKSETTILSFDDSRIEYIENNENIGLIATLNKGLKLAKGKFIARMDHDDISLPNRFTEQVKFLEDNPDIGICGTWAEEFGLESKIVKPPVCHHEIVASLLFQNPLYHPSTMLRKSELSQYNLSYTEGYIQAEDYKLWIDAATHTKLYNLPQVLLRYRRHSLPTDTRSRETDSTIRVKLELVEKLFRLESETEKNEIINIFSGKASLNSITIRALAKICSANKQKKKFQQKILERKLANIWKNSFLNVDTIGFGELLHLYSLRITSKARFTLKQHLYILSKLRLKA
jgi:glycosyltransferase involved in cell wall biosynthesis